MCSQFTHTPMFTITHKYSDTVTHTVTYTVNSLPHFFIHLHTHTHMLTPSLSNTHSQAGHTPTHLKVN